MPPTRTYQERVAKRRRNNPADETRSGPPASQPDPPVLPGPSGLGQLTPEMIAAISAAVTQALQAAAATPPVQFVLNHVIGPQENASTSKNTFLSEAIPLSNIVPEKVKNQIWANEFIDFSLLLKSNISNTDDDQYTIKFETKKGAQPCGACSKCKEEDTAKY